MSLHTSMESRPRPRSVWLRLPVMFVLLLAVDLAVNLIDHVAAATPLTGLAAGVAAAVGALWVYVLLVHRLEGRRVGELARAGAGSGLLGGTLLGLALFSATIAVIAVSGGYRVLGPGSFGDAVTTLGVMCSVAVAEELVFRGALFRLLEEKAGTWGALGVSGLVFGGMHLFNQDATVWGALAIAAEAGLLLGAAFVATRSLWLPIGLHLGWNLAEGGIFGTAVSGSGHGRESLLRASVSGPQALTGGQFGPEAGVAALVVGLVAASGFLMLAKRRGRIHPRSGRRTAG